MPATVAASLLLISAATVLGTAICRLGGVRDGGGARAAVGLAALMVIADPAMRLPGGAVSAAVALAVVTGAGLTARSVRTDVRKGLTDTAAVTLGALLVLSLPWLSAGRFGVLGMGVNNDTSAHLVAAQWLVDHRMPVGDTLVADGYPLGPHSLAAALASVGAPLPAAFSAVAIAGPVTLALAALDAVPMIARPLRGTLAVLVGISYLTASYFAQMAFKETIQGALILAFALLLAGAARAARRGPRAAARATLPLAVLTAGMVDTMSWPGVLWPSCTIAILVALVWPSVRRSRAAVGAAALSAAIASALLISLQLPRIIGFQGSHYAHEPSHGLGDLAHALPAYETLGVWPNPAFQFGPQFPALTAALMIAAVMLGVVGVRHWLRQPTGRALAAALLAGWLVWSLLAVFKNPYAAAKALAIVSPLVALAVVTGAVSVWRVRAATLPTRAPDEEAVYSGVFVATPFASAWRAALTGGSVAVLCAAALSSLWVLRDAAVAPDAHHRELRALAAVAPSGPMLVLDTSDFIAWDLYGVDVWRPPLLYVVHTAPIRPEKLHRGGQPFDLDSVSADTLNHFASVLTDRNAAASTPPPGLRVLRATRSYVLWKRVGTVPAHETLREGWQPGKLLDCSVPAYRALSRRSGWAIVRPPPVIATAPGWHGDARDAGSTATRTLTLPRGRWNVSLQYVSRNPIDVTVGGHTTTLPANLDRLGPLLAAGTTLGGRQEVRIHVHPLGAIGRLLGSPARTRALDSYRAQPLGAVVATRQRAPRRVALSHACGRYADSYTLR